MRRTLTLSTLVAALVLALPAEARAQFEGIVTMEVHYPNGGDATIEQWTSGGLVRMDVSSAKQAGAGMGNGTIIIDAKAKTMTMLMPTQHMYMTRPLKESIPNAKQHEAALAKASWTKTGATASVAGVSCDVYHGSVVEEGSKVEGDLCLAKGIGFMPGAMAGTGPLGRDIGARFAAQGLPADAGIMKATMNEDGKAYVQMVVTKVEKRALSASDFQPPAGYKQVPQPDQ